MPRSLIWFRNDLRLHDNEALNAALSHGETVAIYIKEPNKTRTRARDWWLHHSLESLENSLKQHGIPLVYAQGRAEEILANFTAEQNIEKTFWNRRYTPEGIETDKNIKQSLNAESFAGNLLIEPWNISNKQGSPYKVFTPMWKDLRTRSIPAPVKFKENKQKYTKTSSQFTCTLDDFNLIDHSKTWHKNFEEYWEIGERAALTKCQKFLEEKIGSYKNSRDIPSAVATSTLSPHLHFGEISVRDIWAQIEAFTHVHDLQENEQIECFKSELAWREFSYQTLFNYEGIDTKAIKPNFNNFPWIEDENSLKRWQQGKTGIGIVDAGMRELWHTGTMHNRVRMIVASFLTKNLLIPWQEGAKWFMDTLLDADEASNSTSWQWVAGCGLDAAPYFRIFNPETQAEKFDPLQIYIKKWVPEYGTAAYPKPMVNLKKSRVRALDAYKTIK